MGMYNGMEGSCTWLKYKFLWRQNPRYCKKYFFPDVSCLHDVRWNPALWGWRWVNEKWHFTDSSMATSVRNLNWRYLPYINAREYPRKIWSYMVQYLHFRILKFPLNSGQKQWGWGLNHEEWTYNDENTNIRTRAYVPTCVNHCKNGWVVGESFNGCRPSNIVQLFIFFSHFPKAHFSRFDGRMPCSLKLDFYTSMRKKHLLLKVLWNQGREKSLFGRAKLPFEPKRHICPKRQNQMSSQDVGLHCIL